jgi:hypothetical protein
VDGVDSTQPLLPPTDAISNVSIRKGGKEKERKEMVLKKEKLRNVGTERFGLLFSTIGAKEIKLKLRSKWTECVTLCLFEFIRSLLKKLKNCVCYTPIQKIRKG